MGKIETTDQMKARWAREQVADRAAVSLGLGRQTKQHGIMYWTGNGEQFRAGYWAGRKEPAAVAPTLIDALKSILGDVDAVPPIDSKGCCKECGQWTLWNHREAHEHEESCAAQREYAKRGDWKGRLSALIAAMAAVQEGGAA